MLKCLGYMLICNILIYVGFYGGLLLFNLEVLFGVSVENIQM